MSKYSTPEELTPQAGELLSHLEKLVQRYLLTQESAELSKSETAILRLLAARGASTMSELTTELGIACSSATGIVDRLVQRGYAERTRPDDDRRTVKVALTRRGRNVNQSCQDDRLNLGRGMLEPLDPKERAQLLALFRKITQD